MSRTTCCVVGDCGARAVYRVEFIESWFPACAQHAGEVVSDDRNVIYGLAPLRDDEETA